MNDKLTLAARCALAELVGQFHEGHLSASGRRTAVELHDALRATGENMVDYQEDVEALVASKRLRHPGMLSAS